MRAFWLQSNNSVKLNNVSDSLRKTFHPCELIMIPCGALEHVCSLR